MPFQGTHLGIFPGKPGMLFTVGLLRELDQQCGSAKPTVASFWRMRCWYTYYGQQNKVGVELGAMAPAKLERLREWVNKAYLDFIQLRDVDYTTVFGCTCPGKHGIPTRVVFDGNSLSYSKASAALQKPWLAPEGDPTVPVLPGEVRHPVP